MKDFSDDYKLHITSQLSNLAAIDAYWDQVSGRDLSDYGDLICELNIEDNQSNIRSFWENAGSHITGDEITGKINRVFENGVAADTEHGTDMKNDTTVAKNLNQCLTGLIEIMSSSYSTFCTGNFGFGSKLDALNAAFDTAKVAEICSKYDLTSDDLDRLHKLGLDNDQILSMIRSCENDDDKSMMKLLLKGEYDKAASIDVDALSDSGKAAFMAFVQNPSNNSTLADIVNTLKFGNDKLKPLIDNGKKLLKAGVDIHTLIKMGVKLDFVKDGEKFLLKIHSTKGDAEIQRLFKNAGAGLLKYDKIDEMAAAGLEIVDSEGKVINKNALKKLLDSDAISDSLKNVDNKGLKGWFKKGRKASKIGLATDIVISGAFDIYDNYYDEKTGEWKPITVKRTVDVATDTAIDVGTSAAITAGSTALGTAAGGLLASTAIGASIGTAACPVIGTAIGALIGLGATIAMNKKWNWTDPPKSVVDIAKDEVKSLTSKIGSFFW